MRQPRGIAALAVLLASCGAETEWRTLVSTPPLAPDDPLVAPQPHRDNPLEVIATPDGTLAWVTLQGSADDPGEDVVRVDLQTGDLDRIRVGGSPTGIARHPDGELLVVFNRFSNWLSVLDVHATREQQRLPVDFYATEGVFTPDGSQLWMTNRWRDHVEVWDVRVHRGQLEVLDRASIPVGSNPRDIAISPDGQVVAVAALTGMSVSLLSVPQRAEVARVPLGAPANGLAWVGEHLVVATTSASTHHQALEGPDGDGDGVPGDGTPNINFQDLQNEVAVLSAEGTVLWRATSDSGCCMDYRDVDPTDTERLGDLLPPSDRWIVAGALPEQVVADGATALVSMSGSNEVQRFAVDPATGALSDLGVWPTTGHNPHGLALAGNRVLVAHRLGETLGVYEPDGTPLTEHLVGDPSGGAFPATDAELGELVNFVTAPFSVDGDQTCAHCHREGGNIDKAFSMPLTRRSGVGSRMTMDYRGAADTRPWFFESAMDESNFKPVLNEFARIENFCCTDYTLWPDGAPADCRDNPPPACATEPNAGSADGSGAVRGREPAHPRPTGFASRDAFYEDAAQQLLGRSTSFGDALYDIDPFTGEQRPRPLDFDGITRAIGVFLLTESSLLPNPNDADSPRARRGKATFERLDTSCATCHPSPTFAVSRSVNPYALPLRMGPVVTPNRDEQGQDLDALAPGFVDTFPDAESGRFGTPSLRGIWDRAPSMLHDGRAQGLREVVCTPGHPALLPGETGFNEHDGFPDTHGGVSHLTAAEVADLIAYLETL